MDLDTSCFNKVEIKEGKGLIIDLANLRKKGIVDLYRDPFVKIESNNLEGERGMKVLEWINENTLPKYYDRSVNPSSNGEDKIKEMESKRGYTRKEFHDTFERVRKIIMKYNNENNPSNINDYIDVRLLVQHILEKGDYFLTRNTTDFIKYKRRNIKEELEAEFPHLKIRELNEGFLKEIISFTNI